MDCDIQCDPLHQKIDIFKRSCFLRLSVLSLRIVFYPRSIISSMIWPLLRLPCLLPAHHAVNLTHLQTAHSCTFPRRLRLLNVLSRPSKSWFVNIRSPSFSTKAVFVSYIFIFWTLCLDGFLTTVDRSFTRFATEDQEDVHPGSIVRYQCRQ